MKWVAVLIAAVSVAAVLAVVGIRSFTHHRAAAASGSPVRRVLVHPVAKHPVINWGPPVIVAMVHPVTSPVLAVVHPVALLAVQPVVLVGR